MAAYFIITGKQNSHVLDPSENTQISAEPVAKQATAIWDEATATKIIMDELSKYSQSNISYDNSLKWNHEIVGFHQNQFK